jgi:hypothetical protein
MQERRCDEAPELPRENGFIEACAVKDQNVLTKDILTD